MAIEWSEKINGCHYEVRSAGATLRLYTNKVFHSQYNARKALQGGIWDLLYLPAFIFAPEKLQRVLVLGVGGGTVLQQIQKYLSPESITGIELNPTHLFVAKKYFGLKHSSFKLIEADAISWLNNYSGENFDLIIDDLYGHHNGLAERAIKVNKQWAASLLKHLSPDGIVVINFGDNKEFKNSAMLVYKKIFSRFKSVLRLTLPAYENAIGVFSYQKIDTKAMRENCQAKLGLNKKIRKQKINYTIKTFFD